MAGSPGRLRPIVADAGPLIALAQIDLLPVARSLFAPILVPESVHRECCRDLSLPGAQAVAEAADEGLLTRRDDAAADLAFPAALGPGERSAISLAVEAKALLLIDGRLGRRYARSLGVVIVGVPGLLLQAKALGLIPELSPLVDQLQRKGYRLSPALVEDLRRRAQEPHP